MKRNFRAICSQKIRLLSSQRATGALPRNALFKDADRIISFSSDESEAKETHGSRREPLGCIPAHQKISSRRRIDILGVVTRGLSILALVGVENAGKLVRDGQGSRSGRQSRRPSITVEETKSLQLQFCDFIVLKDNASLRTSCSK